MMNVFVNPESVRGLPAIERQKLAKLVNIYKAHASKNHTKEQYYEGNIPLSEVNLGIAIPKQLAKLGIGCAWGAKTVDVLAARSMFDGFVDAGGNQSEDLTDIVINNDLITEYAKSCRDELKFGCTFATLSADPEIGCKIRFDSPLTASAHWDGEKGRIDYGMAARQRSLISTRRRLSGC